MSETQEEMKIDPSRTQALVSQLGVVRERIANVANGRNVRVNPQGNQHPVSNNRTDRIP